jgi:hypothetical protein
VELVELLCVRAVARNLARAVKETVTTCGCRGHDRLVQDVSERELYAFGKRLLIIGTAHERDHFMPTFKQLIDHKPTEEAGSSSDENPTHERSNTF